MIYIFNPLTLLLIYIAYTKSRGALRTLLTVIGAPIDCIVNLTWFTLIFVDIPKEFLLTQRVNRLKRGNGWKAKLASNICDLLNHFEPNHCD